MAIPRYATLRAVKMQKSLFQLRRKWEKTGGDRQLREGTEEGGKEREGRRSGKEWEKNGSRNLAGASKGTPGNAKYVTEILGDKNKEVRG